MSTGATMESFHVDETACGPLCQHPQCWASNRRVGRGLPRLTESLSSGKTDDYDEGALPTVKIFNFLDEYGENAEDRFPSRAQGKDTMSPSHMRSTSAPNILDANNATRSPVYAPITPFTSPLGIRGGSFRSTRSAGKISTRSRSKTSPKVSHVEMKGVMSDIQPPPGAGTSSFYIWCQSKRSYDKQRNKLNQKENIVSPSTEPMTIQPKDLTNDMVPDLFEKKRTSKHQKGKRVGHDTPTGGRPYTHPTRPSPPVTRRTLPQDIEDGSIPREYTHPAKSPPPGTRKTLPDDIDDGIDDGISQLLSLPKDVLLEVLEYIRKSDMLDKNKVQQLLSTIMPHIHFQPDTPPPTTMMQPSAPTPLLDSGILQNRKVTLHDAQLKPYDRHEFPQQTTVGGKMPLFLDDAVISRMASSAYDTMMEEAESLQREEEEEMELPPAGRMARMKPLGPIKANYRDTEHVYRVTSVSAKGLPPLKPGVRPTKPFDYKNTGPSLDLTLGPLPQPKRASPERAPPTPYSLIASTLHVTMPTVPSPDRTLNTTPAMLSYGKSPVPPLPSCARSSPSPLPSEDFPELHWFDADIEERPLYAMSPSMSTKVPRAPQGTPANVAMRQLYTRESYNPSKVLLDHPEDSLQTSSSPTPHPPINRTEATETLGMGTIHETASTYPGTETVTGFNSRSGFLMSPSKQPVSSVSPNGFNGSYMEQDSEAHGSIAPITPAPMSTTPESWPNVDERDFMRTPEATVQTRLSAKRSEVPAPVAPPPSPEPREANDDFDEFLVNKSTVTSLTPLAEEEEDLNDELWDENAKEGGEETPKMVTFESNVRPESDADVKLNEMPTGDVPVGEHVNKDAESHQDKQRSRADNGDPSVGIKEKENNTGRTVQDSDQSKDASHPEVDSSTFLTQSKEDATGTVNLNTQNDDVTDPSATCTQNDVTNTDGEHRNVSQSDNTDNVNIAPSKSDDITKPASKSDEVTNSDAVDGMPSQSDPNSAMTTNSATTSNSATTTNSDTTYASLPNNSENTNASNSANNDAIQRTDFSKENTGNCPTSSQEDGKTIDESAEVSNENVTNIVNTNVNNSGGNYTIQDTDTVPENDPTSSQEVEKTNDKSRGVNIGEHKDRTVENNDIICDNVHGGTDN